MGKVEEINLRDTIIRTIQGQMVFQIQLTKHVEVLPIARDYMMMPVQFASPREERELAYEVRS